MPVVRMPNGDQVRFPDDMPAEQIKNKILSKFPDAGASQSSGLGYLWNKAMGYLPPEVAKQAQSLMPNWEHNNPSYSPYKPADPQHMPSDAINPVGTDAQMAVGTAAAGVAANAPRILGALSGAKPPVEPPPNVPPANIGQMPTQQSFGANMARNVGQAPSAPAGGIPANPITSAPPLPGTSPMQQGLLQQALHGLGSNIGHGILGHGILGKAAAGLGAYSAGKLTGIF